jgi:Zn-dependent protease
MADRSTLPASLGVQICAACGGQLPASFLACPACGKLVHSDRLKALAAAATEAEARGELAGALAAWREAATLLPPAARQRQVILESVQRLSALVPAGAAVPPAAVAPVADGASPGRPAAGSPRTKWAAGLGTLGILVAKLKWVLLLALGKGKALLVGLTQAKTALSMVIALGVYAAAFGWRFALGLILSIYVHEMGHVVWLRRYGIAATAPMFIPGFGAFVRLKQYPATPVEDARVGLAGPVWGAAAAAVALAAGALSDRQVLLAVGHAGAWINLFNMVPLWQLDGGRAFAALSQRQRGLVAATMWVLALAGADSIFYILAIAATFRAASVGNAPAAGDRRTLWTYLLLAVGLALMVGRHGPAR